MTGNNCAWFARPSEVPPHFITIRFQQKLKRPLVPVGVRLPEEAVDFPETGRADWPVEGFPDVLSTINGPLVSQRLREIIEELEPGMHQFFPCRLFDHPNRGKAKAHHDYFGLYIAQAIPSVDVANSAASVQGQSIRFHMFGGKLQNNFETYVEAIDRITLFGSAISGRHLWENNPRAPGFFISAAFKRRIDTDGVTGLECHPCRVS